MTRTEAAAALVEAVRRACHPRAPRVETLTLLAVALAAYDAATEDDGWRPIETAPRDGTKIDIWQRDERVVDAYWSDIQGDWSIDGSFGPEEPTPLGIWPRVSHWRPLPPPPTPREGDDE